MKKLLNDKIYFKSAVAVLCSGLILNISQLVLIKYTQIFFGEEDFNELVLLLRYSSLIVILGIFGSSITVTKLIAEGNIGVRILIKYAGGTATFIIISLMLFSSLISFPNRGIFFLYVFALTFDALVYSAYRGLQYDLKYLPVQRVVGYCLPLALLPFLSGWQQYIFAQASVLLLLAGVMFNSLKLLTRSLLNKPDRLSFFHYLRIASKRVVLDLAYVAIPVVFVLIAQETTGVGSSARLSVALSLVAMSGYLVGSFSTLNLARYASGDAVFQFSHDIKRFVPVFLVQLLIAPSLFLLGMKFFEFSFEYTDIYLVGCCYLWSIYLFFRPFMEAEASPGYFSAAILVSVLGSGGLSMFGLPIELAILLALLLICLFCFLSFRKKSLVS